MSKSNGKAYLVSISGGKDSQDCLNYILSRYPKERIIPYFCDTGWESEETYEHIKYLEKTLDIKIHTIKSDKYDGFEDMCIKRKGFPSRIGRFCTEELKIFPAKKFIESYKKQGFNVVNVVGVRASESKSQKLKKPVIKNGVVWWITSKRDCENMYKSSFLGVLPKSKKKARSFYKKENAVTTFQPIVYWGEREVYEFNIKCRTKNNPLYAQGFTRVGCMPCINANTIELSLLKPSTIQRIDNLEKAVQATTTNTRPVFFHKGGELKSFKEYRKKYNYNSLNFDLGCINHLGICE